MQPSAGGAPTAARFDLSGLYLSVGGTEARVVGAKQDWSQLVNLSGAIGNKVGTQPLWMANFITLVIRGKGLTSIIAESRPFPLRLPL